MMNKNRVRSKNHFTIIVICILIFLCQIGFSCWLLVGDSASSIMEKLGAKIQFSGTASLTGFEGTQVYYGQTLEKDASLKYGKWNVGGTWTVDTKHAASGTNSVIADVSLGATFKPDLNIFGAATANTTVGGIKTVVKDSADPQNYYTCIDKALKDVSSGTLYVIPTLTSTSVIDTNADIAKTVTKSQTASPTIASGVTLALPYDSNNSLGGDLRNINTNLDANKGELTQLISGSHKFDTNHAYGNATYLKNSIYVGDNVTLTNNGTIHIGGVITGGGGGHNAGFTAGNHAQIVLGEDSKLISDAGTIVCNGYITEKEKNNGSQLIHTNKAKIYQPFTVIDHRGGSAFYGINDGGMQTSAFNRFLLPNVTCKATVEYGSEVHGFADLFTGASKIPIIGTEIPAQHNVTTISLVGTTDDFFLNLASGSSIVNKYDVDTKVTKLEVYGGTTVNTLSLTVTAAGVSVPVSTEDVLFPLSWYFDVHLKPIEGSGQEAKVTFNNQDAKILPGASFKIYEGVKMDIGKLFVYENTWTEVGQTGAAAYPDGVGTLIVNGTLDVDEFNGEVKTEGGGKLIINSSNALSSKEVLSVSGSGFTASATFQTIACNESFDKAYGEMINCNGIGSSLGVLETQRNYNSSSVAWYAEKINIELDARGGTFTQNSSNTYTLKSVVAPYTTLGSIVPVKAGYTQSHWCTDTLCANGATCSNKAPPSIYRDSKYYAIWSANEYDLSLDVNGGKETYSPVKVKYDSVYGSLPTPTRDGYLFDGWYFNGSKIESNTKVTTAGDHTLVASWKEAVEVINITYIDGGTTEVKQLNKGEEIEITPITTKVGHTVTWYYDEACTSAVAAGATATEDVTLWAKWTVNKHTITIKDNTGATLQTIEADYGAAISLTAPTKTGYTFTGWAEAAPSTMPDNDITVTANYAKNPVITLKISSATVTMTVNGGTATSYTSNNSVTVPYDSKIKITSVSYSKDRNQSCTIGGDSVVVNKEYTITADTTIEASSSSACFADGTLITMADGTQKPIEDIRVGDMVLAWDFYKGEYTITPVSLVVSHGGGYYRVMSLRFEDGTVVRIIEDHEFFSVVHNEFISISELNIDEFIGQEFVRSDGMGGYKSVKLVGYSVDYDYTGSYAIHSAGHINVLADGMFTLAPTPTDNCPNFFEFFEYGDNMTYDKDKMQADIDKYGLYTYDDFADYLTYEQYSAYNGQYYKIMVEKGLITFDEIIRAVETYIYPYIPPEQGT